MCLNVNYWEETMMSILWIVEIFGIISSMFAFSYGAMISFKKQGVLFLQIITCAFFCFLLGDLYDFFYLLCIGIPAQGFSIGNLGYVGGMFFLLSSYYGAMDRIGDSGGREFRKYRIISFVAPIFNLLVFIFGCYIFRAKSIDFISIIFSIVICAVSYFALKHLILPDIDFGVLKVMRVYNFFILILCIIQNFYNITYILNLNEIFYVKLLVSSLVLILLPIANRGVKRWSI